MYNDSSEYEINNTLPACILTINDLSELFKKILNLYNEIETDDEIDFSISINFKFKDQNKNQHVLKIYKLEDINNIKEFLKYKLENVFLYSDLSSYKNSIKKSVTLFLYCNTENSISVKSTDIEWAKNSSAILMDFFNKNKTKLGGFNHSPIYNTLKIILTIAIISLILFNIKTFAHNTISLAAASFIGGFSSVGTSLIVDTLSKDKFPYFDIVNEKKKKNFISIIVIWILSGIGTGIIGALIASFFKNFFNI